MTRLWVIGDSWTDPGWMGWGWHASWPAVVARSLGLQLVNSGRSGSGYVNEAAGWTYPLQVARGAGVGADVGIAWGTVNDTAHDPATVRTVSEQTLRAFRAGLAPGAPLLVYGPEYWDTIPPIQLVAVRDAVRASAYAVGAVFVDPLDWMRGRSDLIDATAHPTPEGHAFLAGRVERDLLWTLGSARQSSYGDYPGGYVQPWESPYAAAAATLLEE